MHYSYYVDVAIRDEALVLLRGRRNMRRSTILSTWTSQYETMHYSYYVDVAI